jgi:streptogramin lyase
VSRSATGLGFYHPRSLTVDSNDNVFVADTGHGRIVRFRPYLTSYSILTVESLLKQPVSLCFVNHQLVVIDESILFILTEEGKVVKQWPIDNYSTFQPPRILTGQTSTIIMTSPMSGKILFFDLEGNLIQKLEPPDYPELKQPIGIVAAPDGKIFVAENNANRVQLYQY